MHEETVGSKIVKWVLIGVSVLFLVLMLLLPLLTVISEALRDGWKTYQAAVTDKYTVKAVLLTLEATAIAVGFNTIFGIFAALAVTKFHFRGKKLLTTLIDVPVTISPVIAGLIFLLTFGRQSVIYPLLHDLGIRVVFAVPGIILATVFVTFPFVSRELIPVLESQGTDEEEAAACKRLDDFPKGDLSPYPLGAALRRGVVCGESHGRIRCGIRFVRSPSWQNQHTAAAR